MHQPGVREKHIEQRDRGQAKRNPAPQGGISGSGKAVTGYAIHNVLDQLREFRYRSEIVTCRKVALTGPRNSGFVEPEGLAKPHKRCHLEASFCHFDQMERTSSR
jgi:hypothetical protein